MRDVNFGEQVSIGFVGRVVGAGVAFLGSIWLAREIGEFNFGVFFLMLGIASFLDNPVTGWVEGCRKRFTEEGWDRSGALGAAYLGAIGGSFLILLIAVPLQITVGSVKGIDPLLLWFLFTGVILFVTTQSMVNGTESFGYTTWIIAGRDVVRVGLQVIFVIILSDVFGMVLGLVIANTILIPVGLKIIGIRPTIPTKEQMRSIWTFSRIAMPKRLLGTTVNKSDILLLGFLTLPLWVGNYRVTVSLTMPAVFIGSTLGPGMMSKVSDLSSHGDKVAEQVRRGVGYTSIIAIPVGIGCVVIGDLIVTTVYSQQYSEAVVFIGLVGIYRIFQTQYQVVSSTIDGLNRPDIVLRSNLGGVILNIGLGVGLWWLIGPVGVAVASLISVGLRYVYVSWSLKRLVSVKLVPSTLIHQIISGIIMGIVVWMARQYPTGGWIWVGALVGLGGVVYFTSLWTLSEDFRSLTLSFVPV